MADPFVAEVQLFGFNFAPTGWAQCNGQLMPISQNTALFSLLGTMYGGDGKTTFALPNMQGNLCLQSGQGPGLSLWDQGQMSGSDQITLLVSEMPIHPHSLMALAAASQSDDPTNRVPGNGAWVQGAQFGVVQCYTTQAPDTQMNPGTLLPSGGDAPHNNLMPYLVVNYCIALQGVFPPRT